jgi:hydrogenase maturation factor
VYLFPETRAICQALDLDPLGLIASGALLVTASPHESARMIEAVTAEGIGAAIIGQVVAGPPLVRVKGADGMVALQTFKRDELARVFG